MMSHNDDKKTRFTASLPAPSVNKLRAMAQSKSVTASSVLANAIETEAYLRDALSKGAKLLIEDTDGSVRELIFR